MLVSRTLSSIPDPMVFNTSLFGCGETTALIRLTGPDIFFKDVVQTHGCRVHDHHDLAVGRAVTYGIHIITRATSCLFFESSSIHCEQKMMGQCTAENSYCAKSILPLEGSDAAAVDKNVET